MNTITSQNSDLLSLLNIISDNSLRRNDTNSDGALSIDEVDLEDDIFSSMDSDSDGLLTQSEITKAIDSKLSEYSEMPTSEEFASLLADLGLQMPDSPTQTNNTNSSDFVSELISAYDTNKDSILSEDELSLLTSEEFTALDSDGDGSVTTDELTAAVDSIAAGSTTPVAPGGSSSSSSSEDEEDYDIMDTNEDGVVSREEMEAYYGISNTSESNSSNSKASNNDSIENIKKLFDVIKNTTQDDEEDLKLSNFSNIMKMFNNENNSNEFNTYVNNLSDKSSSLYGYA
ncbi:hypothetical protein CRV08_01165 [Halarcobacter ebronensis]|uniref:EF-hand domain-containing protein n=1 Tax=Halarcobacter ebronensis TaxID=1462615 RepID=A0A4Q0YIL8_9BACT|nr:EF-hand domain-containing protein [Halarcobacter ebronensis]RXJ70203.1 hypothetical protein CRV08_01165 [Halarcobacter ebronensis]